MKFLNSENLIKIAYSSLAVSVLSVFTTIISYTDVIGIRSTFTISDFMSFSGYRFDKIVSEEYQGKLYMTIDISVIRVLCVIAIIAIICAIVGLRLISKQKSNKKSFTLTVVSLIGTMIPSLLILFFVIFLKNQYAGKLSCGIYPIVSPIAMIVCILASTQMYRKNKEYEKKMNEAEGLIFKGGDL